jgi:LAO/AO transport system kinase
VLRCSALTGTGIAEICDRIEAFRDTVGNSGERDQRRRDQAVLWFNRELSLSLIERLRDDPVLAAQLTGLESRIAQAGTAPATAARQLVDALLDSKNNR